MVMGRSQVKEETKERRERGRSIGQAKSQTGGGGRVLGTGGGLAYRKQTPVSWREGGQGTQDAGKLVGGGGWKVREFLRTSISAEKEYAGQRPRVWGFRKEVLL